MIVLAICNTKGGVGKTTLTAALAVQAARESKRVALVDLDPQGSLAAWWMRRGKTDNPCIFRGAETATEAVEALELDGWDWCFLDTPPAFLQLIDETVHVADLVVIPIKPSALDMAASVDAVVIAREAKAAHLVVLNDVEPTWSTSKGARGALLQQNLPVAETAIVHRVSHVQGMNAGKTAAEVNNGKDAKAADEIGKLWAEVKAAALKASKAKRKAAAHV